MLFAASFVTFASNVRKSGFAEAGNASVPIRQLLATLASLKTPPSRKSRPGERLRFYSATLATPLPHYGPIALIAATAGRWSLAEYQSGDR
jgi:hypothetical protein